MAPLRFRDRDAIVTKEDLIFRVFGYSHPPNAYICDAEYAPAEVFKSENPKAPRNKGKHVFYKFYEDEGWKFIQHNFPQYMIFHDLLQREVIGINRRDILEVRNPDEQLVKLIGAKGKDKLQAALQNVLISILQHSRLTRNDFGVFGSMLHGFHHPRFSDIDLIIYGAESLVELVETLQECYEDKSSVLKNEFESSESIKGKLWKFKNYSPKECVWHQRRKMIYALFGDELTGRIIKTEFEPVRDWMKIKSEYNAEMRIVTKGWTKILARIVEDEDAPFIPSIYGIEPLEALDGERNALEASRIISYLEEFRMQAHIDETVRLEGNLEEVTTPTRNFYQVTLTYCPRYYEQVLKVAS